MTECTLPNKLSDLIELALSDLIKCEQDPRYNISMLVWHEGTRYTGKCTVCLAGAVMAKTCGANLETDLQPADFPPVTKAKLRALEHIRNGSVHAAIFEFHGDSWPNGEAPPRTVPAAVLMPPYRENPVGFKNYMIFFASRLREEGY